MTTVGSCECILVFCLPLVLNAACWLSSGKSLLYGGNTQMQRKMLHGFEEVAVIVFHFVLSGVVVQYISVVKLLTISLYLLLINNKS